MKSKVYIIKYNAQLTSWIENNSLKSLCWASMADFKVSYIGKIFKINKTGLSWSLRAQLIPLMLVEMTNDWVCEN